MLPKINRIKKKKDFETIFKNSKGFKNKLFIFRVAKNNLGQNRFGFVVSKKVSKKAVVRNKVKRRLSESVKVRLKDTQDANIGVDAVLIALPGIEKKEFSEVKEAVKSILVEAKIITK